MAVGVTLAALSLFCLLALNGCSGESGSQTKIVNGIEVSEDDPVTTSTVALMTPARVAFCTGILIDRDYVLTAAHCVRHQDRRTIQIYFGAKAIPESVDEDRVRSLVDFRMHENYHLDINKLEPDTFVAREAVNDIALLRLDAAAPKGFAPAAVVSGEDLVRSGASLVLAGYGHPHWEDSELGILRKVVTRLGAVMTDVGEVEILRGEKNSCRGDSGGPAYLEQDTKLVLLGVLSRGDVKCELTGIYTDVRYFKDWIDNARVALQELPPDGNPLPQPDLDNPGEPLRY